MSCNLFLPQTEKSSNTVQILGMRKLMYISRSLNCFSRLTAGLLLGAEIFLHPDLKLYIKKKQTLLQHEFSVWPN